MKLKKICDFQNIFLKFYQFDLVGISEEEYRSVQKIRRVEGEKKLLGRKILSVMKLEGKNWRVEGGEWSGRSRANS